MTVSNHIFETLLNLERQIRAVGASLQREFEYFASVENPNEQTLKAKIRQRAEIEIARDMVNAAIDECTRLDDYIDKLLICLLYYGVSPVEVEVFTNRRKSLIEKDLKEVIHAGFALIPDSIKPLIDKAIAARRWDEWLDRVNRQTEAAILRKETAPREGEPPAPVFVTKPLIPFESLKRGAENNGPSDFGLLRREAEQIQTSI